MNWVNQRQFSSRHWFLPVYALKIRMMFMTFQSEQCTHINKKTTKKQAANVLAKVRRRWSCHSSLYNRTPSTHSQWIYKIHFYFNNSNSCAYTVSILLTALMSKRRTSRRYVGMLVRNVYSPQLKQVWATNAAHTGRDFSTFSQGVPRWRCSWGLRGEINLSVQLLMCVLFASHTK